MKKQLVLGAAVTTVVALGTAVSSPAFGAHDDEKEQCAGVIRGGKNDCATSTNACHGHVMEDGKPDAWIYVPKGTCDKIANARIVKVAEPKPAKS